MEILKEKYECSWPLTSIYKPNWGEGKSRRFYLHQGQNSNDKDREEDASRGNRNYQ